MDTRYALLIAIMLAAFASCQDCPAYVCDAKLPEGKCLSPTLPPPIKKYTVNKCPENKKCPIDYEKEMPNELSCEDMPKVTYKLYPGEACKENTDCLGETCKDGLCTGIAEDNPCTMVGVCYMGFTCRKKIPSDVDGTCLKPKIEGGYCEKDTDCENTLGCYDGKCTMYFSFPDGTKIKADTPFKTLSFCQSGFQRNGECISLLNYRDYTSPCGPVKPCMYLDAGGNEVSAPENCECGYNPSGSKFCKLGNAEFNHTRYLNLKKELFVGSANCHAAERGVFCGKDMRDMKEEFKTKLQKFYSYRTWSENEHKIVQAEHPCTTVTMFPELDPSKDEPQPYPQPKCAKYTCVKDKDKCATSKWFGKGNITVELTEFCKKNEFCSVNKVPNVAFYLGKDVTGTCAPLNGPDKKIRFPGEECVKNDECVNPSGNKDLGKCQFSHCHGFNVTETCADTSECWAGLFCNEETKKCEKQKSSGACKKTWECENHLACFDGTCQDKFYSQKSGEKVEGKTDMASSPELFCEFATVVKGQCAYLNETATAKPDPKTGLVKCEIGTECEYDYFPVDLGKIKKWCECGYNEAGQAYCPLSNGQKIDTWKQYFTAVKRSFKNKCHSMNRFNCYIADESALTDVRYYDHRTIHSHLFTDSVQCAEKVLGSSFIEFSMGIMVLLALLLI